MIKKTIWHIGRALFNALPFNEERRERVYQRFSPRFAMAFDESKGAGERDNARYRKQIREMLKKESNGTTGHFVPRRENEPLPDPPVKIIAFYLPQFHAIPENDRWWGEGFTEWTNVRPAKPLFAGHYQPHIPGGLGYYDLLDVTVQERQVELARNYGIGGFCFHFYWFNGKRLLEGPIENYLDNPQLDLPFCLSWANENWTRRWDGRENEILIRQHHSPEDDLAFIRHVSTYMQDRRYIRIGGKPLLMVYRPELLPGAAETAGRWRQWCRENGIGEIFLANVQSFEKINPSAIGYDAAVEFPPNSFNPLNVTHIVRSKNRDFRGVIFDWKTVKDRSRKYSDPGYRLFRSVCPSWDNTPRRGNESTLYINSTAGEFGDWVFNAAADTLVRSETPDDRLVFVNAWNEWAEGAHLEPDQRYGYAFLQSLYDALRKISGLLESNKKVRLYRSGPRPKILIVSYNIPRPDKSSGELRFVSILEILRQFWDIDFCVADTPNTDRGSSPAYLKNLSGKGIRVLPLRKSAFRRTILKNEYAGAYFNQYWVAETMMPLFSLAQPGAFTIVDSVDVQYAREESQARRGEVSYEKVRDTRSRELAVYHAADAVIAVSRDDYNLLSEAGGLKNLFLIPNLVKESPRMPGKRRPVVIFIGCYAWYPNPAAVTWFARDIWPAVRREVPDAEFLVIGSDPTPEVSALAKIPGIKVPGWVPETKPYLDMAAVSVAPLTVGGGMKGKVNEAMAHGIPVVATTIGAQGFGATHGREMMVTDDPSEFASCVIRLLKDETLQAEVGLAGQRLNAAICSREAVAANIEELADYCTSLTPRKQPDVTRVSREYMVGDIGHAIRLLKREGAGPFFRRCRMYLRGQRLETVENKEDKGSGNEGEGTGSSR